MRFRSDTPKKWELLKINKGGEIMYEFECLTDVEYLTNAQAEDCSPFLGECYPVAVGNCKPDRY